MSKTMSERMTDWRTDKGMKWLNGLVALLGLWIVASSFVFTGMSQASFWNNIVIGAALTVSAGYNAYRLMNEMPASVGSAALATLLGVWMVVAPFVFQVTLTPVMWSDAIAGVIVAILAGYSTYAERKAKRAPVAGT